MRTHLVVIALGAFASQKHLRGEGCTVQGDGHAVSRERGDDRGLIADAPKAIRTSGEVAVGDGRNGQWPLPEWRCAAQPLRDGRVFILDGPKQLRPSAFVAQYGAANNKTKIRNVAFNQRESAIAPWKEKKFNVVAQSFSLRRSEPPMKFEADKVTMG